MLRPRFLGFFLFVVMGVQWSGNIASPEYREEGIMFGILRLVGTVHFVGRNADRQQSLQSGLSEDLTGFALL